MTNSPDNIVITPLQESHYGALVEIYNHYIINTAITFDIEPYTIATRAPWFAGFDGARHVCLVAEQDGLPHFEFEISGLPLHPVKRAPSF